MKKEKSCEFTRIDRMKKCVLKKRNEDQFSENIKLPNENNIKKSKQTRKGLSEE